ncbi:MAG: ABC transporter ATP-binding protein [Desulfovibrionaceae bacterium]|nr:ABC transporter ATP-binding protein [Desulfovibrionaceae bacterium]
MEAWFLAHNLNKTFRRKDGKIVKALQDFSLKVLPGTLSALVGPDGAGKTTFLRLAAGLLRPNSGKLILTGQEYEGQASAILEKIAYMPQKFGLYEDLTVEENLDLYADLKNVEVALRESRYGELLAMAGLAPFRQRLAGRLSGGMKQKLGLICTLISPPELLLLDEPTVGVDPLSRQELWEMIGQLKENSNLAVLVSTSYLDEAQNCDQVVMLLNGETLAKGPPKDICQVARDKCWRLTLKEGLSPRRVQAWLQDQPLVLDAVPEAGNVRVVLKSPKFLEEFSFFKEAIPVAPRLEDSFMLLMPGEKEKLGPNYELKVASKTSQDIVIQTKNVYRLFGDFVAVRDVSFTVYRGEVFGLLGPNGAGKTTTFRMLCGLLPASKGSLIVAGVDVSQARALARRHLGYVAQKFSLYGPLTVRENLEFFAGAYGLRGRHKQERIHAMVEDFSLEAWMEVEAQSLPGGLQRNLAMAVGLLHEPEILFLDEPTSGADPLARRQFWRRIAKLSEQGVTIIVTTHFMEEAEYCDHILIQDGGIRLALGTPAEIRAQALKPNASMEEAFIAIVLKSRAKKKDS